MDVHDGSTLLIGNTYYYYGEQYGDCKEPQGDSGCAPIQVGACGFRLDHNVSLYTSNDLGTWTRHPVVFQFKDSPIPGVMFCPKVIYNPATTRYVLWYNWIIASGGFSTSYYGVAESSSPFGPFKVVNPNVTTLAYTDIGDFSLFLDDNGDGYIIYTSHITGAGPNHLMSVEQLSPDFLSTQGKAKSSGFFGQSNVEAPAMFKSNGVYFTVFGPCCCYCKYGSPVTYYRSGHPLGPYTTGSAVTDSSIHAQQTNILPFRSATGQKFLWQGDMWQSAPDGEKGHDFTYFGLMSIDNNGDPTLMKYEASFTLEMP